jgi:hypothetical protein
MIVNFKFYNLIEIDFEINDINELYEEQGTSNINFLKENSNFKKEGK